LSYIPNMFDNLNNNTTCFKIMICGYSYFYKTNYLSSKIKIYSMYFSSKSLFNGFKLHNKNKKHSCNNLPNSIKNLHCDQTTFIVPYNTINVKCHKINFIKNKTFNFKCLKTHNCLRKYNNISIN